MWTREGLSWVAGLLEGEGSFLHGKVAPSRNISGKLVRLEVCCTMTDRDVLEKLREKTGLGSVFGPYKNGSRGRKPVWIWRVQSGRSSYALCIALLPFMGERRKATILQGISEWVSYEKVYQRSEGHPMAILTNADVAEIRQILGSRDRFARGEAAQLGARFGVQSKYISRVARRGWVGVA